MILIEREKYQTVGIVRKILRERDRERERERERETERERPTGHRLTRTSSKISK